MEISNDHLSVELVTFGAELQSIRTRDGMEWLWQGDPAFWSGRSPLLFPTIGKSPGHRVRIDGVAYPMMPHGFAMRSEFQIVAQEKNLVTLVLESSERTLANFPFVFHLIVSYALKQGSIECIATVVNLDCRPMPFQFGFHPGIAWPLPGSHGRLHEVVLGNGGEPPLYRLDDEMLLSDRPVASPFRAGRLTPSPVHFEDDAMLFLSGAGESVSFSAQGGARVEMHTVNLPHLALWQEPGAGFLCLEPWHGTEPFARMGDDLETRNGSVSLLPGERTSFQMNLTFVSALTPGRAPGGGVERWLGSSEQPSSIAKWSVCRFHAAARSGWLK